LAYEILNTFGIQKVEGEGKVR